MAATLECCNCQLSMGIRRSKNVNYIRSLADQSFHRWEYFGHTEASSQACSARSINIGDSHKPRVRNSLESAGVKLANVAGSDQSDPEICIYRHAGFRSHLLGVSQSRCSN